MNDDDYNRMVCCYIAGKARAHWAERLARFGQAGFLATAIIGMVNIAVGGMVHYWPLWFTMMGASGGLVFTSGRLWKRATLAMDEALEIYQRHGKDGIVEAWERNDRGE